jgi:hypothetical protein
MAWTAPCTRQCFHHVTLPYHNFKSLRSPQSPQSPHMRSSLALIIPLATMHATEEQQSINPGTQAGRKVPYNLWVPYHAYYRWYLTITEYSCNATFALSPSRLKARNKSQEEADPAGACDKSNTPRLASCLLARAWGN